MVEPLLTGSAISAGWKILGSLYEKYQAWSIRKSKSQKAQVLQQRAEQLMNQINAKILSGASSDDPDLFPLIKEFRALLEQDAKPSGHEKTEDWIVRSQRPAICYFKAAAKPALKKAAAKPMAKSAAPKAMARKAAAKPVAKSAVRKPMAKKSAAKPIRK